MKRIKQYLSILIIAIIGGIVSVSLYKAFDNKNEGSFQVFDTAKMANYEIKKISIPDFDFVDVAELTTSTVVHIKTKVNQKREHSQSEERRRPSPFDFFEHFDFDAFSPPREGSGSGVIITSNGYIVTNNHVIDNADIIEITLFDNSVFRADVIGTDPNTDLALLKIEAVDLKPLRFGNSDNVRIGQWVLAVGNPFNLNSTVTAGIVSAKGRNINLLGGGSAIESFIQTDAAVNPGNSGGALINTKGELIGINTAIATRTGQYAGYSFAIPVNIVKKVVDDIMEFGEVQRGFIGVNIENVNAEIAGKLGLKNITGVYVAGLMEGGAAEKAGIKKEDVIVAIDEINIRSVPQLQEIVSSYRPGDKVNVTVVRGGKQKQFEIILRNRDGEVTLVTSDRERVRKLLGAEFEVVHEADKKNIEISHGAKITKLSNGKLKKAGVPEGFIISRINNNNIYTTADIYRIFTNHSGGVLIEGINPDGTKGYYGFGIE